MTLKVIRYADTPDSVWANGCGSTRLLWSDPAGERRISVARLAAPTPFSRLPGMARVLLVLEPIRFTLRVNGAVIHLAQNDIFIFSGNDAVELADLDRPGRVLNLMALASRWRPRLSASANPPPFAWIAPGDSEHGGTPLHTGDLIFSTKPIPQAPGIHFEPIV